MQRSRPVTVPLNVGLVVMVMEVMCLKKHFRAKRSDQAVQTEVAYGGSGLYQESDPHIEVVYSAVRKYELPLTYSTFCCTTVS